MEKTIEYIAPVAGGATYKAGYENNKPAVFMIDTDGETSVIDYATTPEKANIKAIKWQKKENKAVLDSKIIKLSDVKEKVKGFSVITQNKKKGVFVAKRSYFYKTTNIDTLIGRIKEAYPNATIEASGDHWHAFVGGAPSGSAKDSYLWIEFKINS